MRHAGPALGVLVGVAVLAALHHVLSEVRYHEVVRDLAAIPGGRVAGAALLAAASYACLILIDALALAHLNRKVRLERIAFASFVASALGHNVGFSVLSGGSVRMRLYTAWGLAAGEVATLIGVIAATTWLGFAALGGATFLIEVPPPALAAQLPQGAARVIGVALVLVVAAYFVWSLRHGRALTLRGLTLPVPAPRIAAAQIAVSALDWAVAGSALYLLLPDSARVSLPAFLGSFLLAQLVGVASQSPGGLGVFETVVLVVLHGTASQSELVGALVAYRAVYYVFPLLLAAIGIVAQQTWQRRRAVQQAATVVARWAGPLAPQLLAVVTLLGGVVLLVSGATPAVTARLQMLHRLVPLPVIEVSHFLGSVAGVGLVVLARGLQRRLDAAWHLAVAILAGGIVVSLLKGLDYEEALILALLLAILVPSRPLFYRRASLLAQPLTTGWIVAIVVVILASVWLGLFAYRHVEYRSELWWQFALRGDAPRFLRASVGVVIAALSVAVARLLRGHAASVPAATPDLDTVIAPIVAAAPESSANLALLGDKEFLVHESGLGFVMYGIEGRSWVAMGGPVSARPEIRRELAWSFRELVDEHGGWTVFYEVGSGELPLYIELGLTLVKLGEEARVPLSEFSLEGSARKALRYVVRRLEREDCTAEIVPASAMPVLVPELRRVSDAWLAARKTREKGFSLGRFDERYMDRFATAVVRQHGQIVAFANIWASGQHEELSVDLMRHVADAPSGTMDYLFTTLMDWGSKQGYRWFNLGMAPLAGLERRALAPLWTKVGAAIFEHGEGIYNFHGLRQFKEKFDPVWEPRYLAAPGGLALPRVLANVAALISGGLRGVVSR